MIATNHYTVYSNFYLFADKYVEMKPGFIKVIFSVALLTLGYVRIANIYILNVNMVLTFSAAAKSTHNSLSLDRIAVSV